MVQSDSYQLYLQFNSSIIYLSNYIGNQLIYDSFLLPLKNVHITTDSGSARDYMHDLAKVCSDRTNMETKFFNSSR